MEQIKLFEKSYIDINNEQANIEVVDTGAGNNGQSVVDFVRNRSNTSAWVTSGSLDSHNTRLVFNFSAAQRLDTLIFIKHNFKNYTVEVFTGGTWVLVETVTDNDKDTTSHQFDEVVATAARITITGTIIPDSNKFLFQAIATRKFESGQLKSWAKIEVILDQQKKVSRVLSGKANIVQSVGGYEVSLSVDSITDKSDIALLEEMYNRFYEGFLIWTSGGDDEQFTAKTRGFSNDDLMLVKPSDNYRAGWFEGLYKAGKPVRIRLREVIR